MANAATGRSLRSEFHVRPARRAMARMPRVGDRRGLVADLAPPKERPPARGRFGSPPKLRNEPAKRVSKGAGTLLTMSVIFNWFGL